MYLHDKLLGAWSGGYFVFLFLRFEAAQVCIFVSVVYRCCCALYWCLLTLTYVFAILHPVYCILHSAWFSVLQC